MDHEPVIIHHDPFRGMYPAESGVAGLQRWPLRPHWFRQGGAFRREAWPTTDLGDGVRPAVPVATVVKSGGGWLLRTADKPHEQVRLRGAELAVAYQDARHRCVPIEESVLAWADRLLATPPPAIMPGQQWLVKNKYRLTYYGVKHDSLRPDERDQPMVPRALALLWGPGGPWMHGLVAVSLEKSPQHPLYTNHDEPVAPEVDDARTNSDRDSEAGEE